MCWTLEVSAFSSSYSACSFHRAPSIQHATHATNERVDTIEVRDRSRYWILLPPPAPPLASLASLASPPFEYQKRCDRNFFTYQKPTWHATGDHDLPLPSTPIPIPTLVCTAGSYRLSASGHNTTRFPPASAHNHTSCYPPPPNG